jgi:hypothetical protein
MVAAVHWMVELSHSLKRTSLRLSLESVGGLDCLIFFQISLKSKIDPSRSESSEAFRPGQAIAEVSVDTRTFFIMLLAG